jgi:hypothetical protein
MRPSTLSAALLFCSLAFLPTLHAQPAPDYKSNPKFTAAIAEARQLEKQRQVLFAIEAYKKASKIAKAKDSSLLETIFTLEMKYGSYKDAAVTAAALEAIAANPTDTSYAETKPATPSSFRPQTRTKPVS